MRCWCSSRCASSRLTPSFTVTSFLVISSETGVLVLVAKRTSRLVRMPTSLPCLPASTTGMPEMFFSSIRLSASASVAVGAIVIGIDHHAGHVALDHGHLLGLHLGRQVAVDHADAAGLRHGDGEPALGHGVHGRGDDGDLDLDLAGHARADVGLGWEHVGGARLQEHVVERQRHGGLVQMRAVAPCSSSSCLRLTEYGRAGPSTPARGPFRRPLLESLQALLSTSARIRERRGLGP